MKMRMKHKNYASYYTSTNKMYDIVNVKMEARKL